MNIKEMSLEEFMKNYAYAEKIQNFIIDSYDLTKDEIKALKARKGDVIVRELNQTKNHGYGEFDVLIDIEVHINSEKSSLFDAYYNTKTKQCFHS